MKRIAVALFAIGLYSSISARAAGSGESPSFPAPLLGGIIQERDVTLVFDYLRDALKAGMQGRQVEPPKELTQRAEAIGEEVKERGATAARAAIDAIEDAVRESLRERDRLPPADGHQRI
jgi:hypothetical protein